MLKKILLNLAALLCALIVFGIFPNQILLALGVAPEWVGLLKVMTALVSAWVFLVCVQKKSRS